MLLDNEKGAEVFLLPVERRLSPHARQRVVIVGQVWSADLAETLIEVYSHLIRDGFSLEDISGVVQDLSHDGPGN